MDPVSVVGLIGSIISIADIVTKSIHKLSDLRTKDRNAPMQVTTLIGQLYIIKAVIEELTRWKSNNGADSARYHELIRQIEHSLECFCPMILSLEQYLKNLEVFSMANAESPDLQNRLSYLWNENDIATYMALIDRQVNALNLFLQAVQCSTWAEQQRMMGGRESQDVLKQAKDCSSSIRGLADGMSFVTENTNVLSVQFDFDSVVMGSQVYRTAHKSHLKQIIKADRLNQQATAAKFFNTQEVQDPQVEDDDTIWGMDVAQTLGLQEEFLNYANNRGKEETDNDALGSKGISPPTSPPSASTIESRPPTSTFEQHPPLLDSDFTGAVEKPLPVPAQEDQKEGGYVQGAAATFASKGKKAEVGNEETWSPLHQETKDSAARKSREESFKSHLKLTRPTLISQGSSAVSAESRDTVRSRLRVAGLASIRNTLRQRYGRATQNESLPSESEAEAPSYEKVLLLGSSESGKSTLLKLLKLTFEGDFDIVERQSWADIVFSNLVQSTRVILEAMESLEIPLEEERSMSPAETVFMQPARYESYQLPPGVPTAIEMLWQDAGVLECYRRRHEYQLNTSTEMFAKDIGRIGSSNYIPSTEDVLRSRVKTTGITETHFNIGVDARRFIVYDVGGVRSERKKWIYVFENVSTIIFTVDVTSYCKLLFEDETVNRMQEALNIFESIVNSRWFIHTKFILVFTHLDQLEDTTRIQPIRKYFPDFIAEPDGPEHISLYLDYLKGRFRSLCRRLDKSTCLRVISTDLINGDRDSLMRAIVEPLA